MQITDEQLTLQRAGCGKAARPDSVGGMPRKGHIYPTSGIRFTGKQWAGYNCFSRIIIRDISCVPKFGKYPFSTVGFERVYRQDG